jgi:hypothetical protein
MRHAFRRALRLKFYCGLAQGGERLIRIQLLLILALVLDNNGVIFPIVWILFFVDRMHPAAIFTIAMRVIHLRLTRTEETSAKLGNTIGSPNV